VSSEHYILRPADLPKAADVHKPVSLLSRIGNNTLLRRTLVVLVILAVWEVAARLVATPLILPTVTDTLLALKDAILSRDDGFLGYVAESLRSLLTGFALGTAAAALLTVFAYTTRVGEDFLSTVTSAFAPLPAVAIFPLAMMWFGISWTAIVFITTWATVFPVAVAMFQGFRGVSPTLRAVGTNYGLKGLRLTAEVLIPAALPSIMTGLRSGLSNAFRALVALEMVVGAAAGKGGLGWFVMAEKQNLEIPTVFAGILAIMAIGLAFEGLFALLERVTVRRWGMLR
jgi:NitT/TauT family transport system permease protein